MPANELAESSPVDADTLVRWLHAHRGTVGVAGLVSFAGPTTFFAGAASVMESPDVSTIATLALSFVVYAALLWLLLLVCGYAYWRASPDRRAGQAALALVLACAAVGVADTATAQPRARINIEQGVVASRVTMQLYSATFSLAMALLFFAHLQLGRAHEGAAARLVTAQAAQRVLRRRAVASQLKAVQARIDPQLLFDLLDEVRRCYERDAERAEQVLDELVAFLREALPRLRSASSSVSREAQLARAYLRLRSLASDRDFQFALCVTPDAMEARFPPGVLLPLIDDALRRGHGPCELQAVRTGSDCRIAITLPTRPSQGTLDRVRALLDELYANPGGLSCEDAPDGSATVRVAIPHEPA